MINFSKILNIRKTVSQQTVKQSSIYKVRAISKIPYYVHLTAFESALAPKNGRLLFQFNCSLPANFRIIEPIRQSVNLSKGILTVKFRVGSIVYRYVIWGDEQKSQSALGGDILDIYDFPIYTNELIGKNCCFEYWSIQRVGVSVVRPNGILDFKLHTSLSFDPSTVEQTEVILEAGNPIEPVTLGSTFPEALPTSQETIAWLDNIL